MSTPTVDLDTARLAHLVDHTLLLPGTTTAELEAHLLAARSMGVYAVCVSPSVLPLTVELGDVLVATVCGFPSGRHHSEIKAAEAARAVADGADEIDMVINLGDARDGRWAAVEADIAAVRAATPAPVVLKVIIESAALDDAQIVAACRAAQAAGADYVKTSTGFHPAGGATVDAVRLMAATVGERLGVKASGGIRTRAQAEAMVAAGATRLGLSGTAAVLAGSAGTGGSGY